MAGEATLVRLVEDINRLAAGIHRVSRQLHPAILEDLGLPAALKSECLAFSEQYGMSAEFESFAVPRSHVGVESDASRPIGLQHAGRRRFERLAQDMVERRERQLGQAVEALEDRAQ